MKYSINILLGLLLFNIAFVSNSYSQENLRIGIKAGLNVANIKGYGTSLHNSSIGGLNAGVYANVILGHKMGITAEALFSQKGTITKIQPNYQYVRINYIDIPVFFTYELSKGLTAQIGLGTGIPITAYVREGSSQRDFLYTCTPVTFSIPMGMVYEFDNGFNVGWRADFGASYISTPTTDGGRNYVFMLSAGYSFYKKDK